MPAPDNQVVSSQTITVHNPLADRAASVLTKLITDGETLCDYLELDKAQFDKVYHLPASFALKVPYAFAAKMRKGDINDPLLQQVLPSFRELSVHPDFSTDPLAERAHNPVQGLLHKYQNRVLITLTGACAVHCRYCFRQHFDYQSNLPKKAELSRIAHYINNDKKINEIILSGGDPLNISNRRLRQYLQAFEDTHVTTIRLHTRLPIVLPERIDDELCELLQASGKKIVLVVHTNHPNELGCDTKDALKRLAQAQVTLLNQSVLLKGINDDVDTLVALSHKLFAMGVLPYYLHMLDKVQGAEHFLVEEATAVTLYWQLLARLSGYLVPKLVQELPHKPYKTPVNLYANA